MNEELFWLSVQSIRRKKRSSLLLFAVLFLSFAFAIVSLTVTGSMQKTNQEYRYDVYGEWHGAIYQAQDGDEEFLREQEWLSQSGVTRNCGTIPTKTGAGSNEGIGVMDGAFLELGRISLQDGRFPETAGEIAMEADLLSALGYDYTLGQEITLPVLLPAAASVEGGDSGEPIRQPVTVSVEQSYTLCGVLREYTDLWVQPGAGATPLNSAMITPAGAQVLRQRGAAAAEKLRVSMNEARIEEKTEGVVRKIALNPMTAQYFFSVLPGMEETAEKQVNDYLLSTRKVAGNAWRLTVNTAAISEEEAAIESFYTVLILTVMLLAVVCIYVIRMQDEARQLAIFRSIGVTRRQLCVMLLYETLLLGVPAMILGAGAGALGTWAFLRLTVYSGSVTVYAVVPPVLLTAMAALWIIGVLTARLAVFLVALRAPLTGRFHIARKKAKRHNDLRRVLIAALSVLLCTAVIFTVMESLLPVRMIQYVNSLCDYAVTKDALYYPGQFRLFPVKEAGSKKINYKVQYNNLDATIPTEAAIPIRQIPGVDRAWGFGQEWVRLEFDGMDDIPMTAACKKVDHELDEMQPGYPGMDMFPIGTGPYDPDAMAVPLLIVDEGEWEGLIDFDIDPEKFGAGEAVLMSFPLNENGKFRTDYSYIEEGEFEETGLSAGDVIRVTVGTQQVYNTVEAEVGGIVAYPADAHTEELPALGEPYTVICSGAFVERLLDSLGPGVAWNTFRQGTPYGYEAIYVYADQTADYLSTDTVLAEYCAREGLTLYADLRPLTQTTAQQYTQRFILIFSGGFCVTLVVLLILWNALSMEAERKKRNIGIQQALGMSRRQVNRRQLGIAALRSALGIVIGWLIYGGYWLIFVLGGCEMTKRTSNSALSTWAYLRQMDIENQVYALTHRANNWPVILLLTVLCLTLILAVSHLARRRLTREDLMAKLRDEH